MLIVDNISKSYRKIVFENFSYKFNDGFVYLVIGDNSSGKSTFINVLGGAVKYINGDIILDTISERSNSVEYRKNISIHFSNTNLFSVLSPKQFWDFHFNSFGEKVDIPKIMEMADQLKLTEIIGYQDQALYTLSSGTKRKVFLIASLLREAKLYLLDEPDSSLDKDSQIILCDYIKNLRDKGKIVIVVTHSKYFQELLQEIENHKIIYWEHHNVNRVVL